MNFSKYKVNVHQFTVHPGEIVKLTKHQYQKRKQIVKLKEVSENKTSFICECLKDVGFKRDEIVETGQIVSKAQMHDVEFLDEKAEVIQQIQQPIAPKVEKVGFKDHKPLNFDDYHSQKEDKPKKKKTKK